MSFNTYPKNFHANDWGRHKRNAAAAVRGFLKRERGGSGSTEPLVGNGSLHPTLPGKDDTIFSTGGAKLYPCLPAEEYESGAVEKVVEDLCASVNVNMVLGETRPTSFDQATYQDFKDIRSRCLREGRLFEDPKFPAIDRSLSIKKRLDRPITWLRPGEICDNPQLFVEGYSRFGVQQGELGDCWLLAAVANLTLHRKLFFQVVPDDQSFDEEYAGVFHFRFWQYGRWVDVVIDDRLPTYRGKLVFLHSSKNNEFWSALLEKAYAKLHGSYEALKGGLTSKAMEDFTGGVTEMYNIAELPPNFYTILLKAYERNSLMACSIEPDPNILETETPVGLITGHAYSITRVKYVDIKTHGRAGKIPLLRMRNPWGYKAEWNGPWSDKSPEWRFIPKSEKEELGLTFDDDGEFWMSFKDFISHFSRVEICNLNPDSLDPEECPEGCTKKWEMSVFEREWVRGVGRITENTPKHQGVVVYSMSDIPLGFGVAARSTVECRNADPLATIAFHQADVGEYIRAEDTLT